MFLIRRDSEDSELRGKIFNLNRFELLKNTLRGYSARGVREKKEAQICNSKAFSAGILIILH